MRRSLCRWQCWCLFLIVFVASSICSGEETRPSQSATEDVQTPDITSSVGLDSASSQKELDDVDDSKHDGQKVIPPQPEHTTEPIPDTRVFRLHRVLIPPDSPHRMNGDLNNPPLLYLVIRENGQKLGKASDDMRGWEVEYPKKNRNIWSLSGSPNTSYVIELWDNQWFDQQVLTITGLKSLDFLGPVKERIAEGYPEASATVIEFLEVPTVETVNED